MKFAFSCSGATLLALALFSPSQAAGASPGARQLAMAEPAQTVAAEAAAAAVEPTAAESAASGAGWNPRSHHPRRGALESQVRLLTAELQLDANQQQQVRRILDEQRQQTLKAWSAESAPSNTRMKTTQAIAEQTADRIRAVLTEAQRKKYPQPRLAAATPLRQGADRGRSPGQTKP